MKTATKLPPTRNGHAKIKEAVASTLADQIRADSEQRRLACLEDLQEVLKRHNCAIQISPVVQIEGRPIQVVVVPLVPT